MGDVRTELARRQMIDAAERLVGERGLAAMSLRDVQREAGQRNKSAATYHFGSRHGLIEAVLRSRMAAVNARRVELLADLDSRGHPVDVHGLVDALIRPIAEHTVIRPESHWARFLFRCSADPEINEIVTRSVESESHREVRRRLLDSLEHLPTSLRGRRIDHAFAMALTSLAWLESRRDSGRRPGLPAEVQVSDLVDICTAIVSAPPSGPTLAVLAASTGRSR